MPTATADDMACRLLNASPMNKAIVSNSPLPRLLLGGGVARIRSADLHQHVVDPNSIAEPLTFGLVGIRAAA
jgi:hypothetical protein